MAALSFPLERTQPMTSFLQRHSRLLATSVILCFAVQRSISNYYSYLALGPGGLPYNVYGWLIALSFKPYVRDKLSTGLYDQGRNKQSFFDDREIKERRGDRPKMGWHVFPSRQLDRHAPLVMRQRLVAVFDALAEANRDLVSVVRSRFEHMHPAFVINESVATPHTPAENARREICHIHRDADFSLHIMMSPQDSRQAKWITLSVVVIEKGWGERHPLSGSRFLPKEYMLLYAPRDEEELAMIARCMCAAVGYITMQ